jgi:SAM-dependent methyltransferase
MSAARPALAARVRRKLRSFFMRDELDAYLATMSTDNPLRGLPVWIVGDTSADPTEFFTHYDAFGYWVAQHLARGNRRRILDIGSPKTQNAILSASHDVTALVLADCSDSLSAVNYVRHDVTRPLPFADGAFDCITSTVSLNLVGLGRYGDRVDADAIPNLIGELTRVAAPDARMLISLPSGPNLLAYNNHWCFDLEHIVRLFRGWRLVEALADGWSSPKAGTSRADASRRFVRPDGLPPMQTGDYRVVFCNFVRDGA